MKTIMVAGLMAASCLNLFHATYAMAGSSDTPFYVGIQGDIAKPSDSDVSGAATGKVKYGFSSGAGIVAGWEPEQLSNDSGDVRLEAEGSYHAFGLNDVLANSNPSGDVKATILMGNVYYDFKTASSWTPYIGAGVGQAFVKFPKGQGLGNSDGSSNVFAYQAMTGVSYTPEAAPQTDWTLGYKYLGFEGPSYGNGAGADLKVKPLHESALELGMRYHF